MPDKLEEYKQAAAPIPEDYRLWPLYGAGFENMGKDGQTIEAPYTHPGPDELSVRHDAVGLCFSDIKIINLGPSHPRIFKDMKVDPVVMGHEVSMTVVEVGENLKDRYKPGDRLIIEADIYENGVSKAYGYTFQGGLSQYAVIDKLVLNSDGGNMLIPTKPGEGYAESALTEPWACVTAAYRLEYRTGIKPGGTLWVIGAGDDRPYTIKQGYDAQSHPSRVLLSNVPPTFEAWLRQQGAAFHAEVIDVPDVSNPPVAVETVDDIVLLGANPDLVETASPYLASHGVFAILAEEPMPRKTAVDVGRVHYMRWIYAGGASTDVADAYNNTPIRAALKPGGTTWFVGAGGPIGRMHVQRAIGINKHPGTIVCTDISADRLDDLCVSFKEEAEAKGIEWVCLNPNDKQEYAEGMAKYFAEGFDDVIVLVPVPAVISDAASHAGECGVVNVFAGINKGNLVQLDLSDVYLKGVRMIGHSGSEMVDMHVTLQMAADDELSRNRSVAAVGSLGAARDGLMALKNTVYPGKVVIYPNIKDFPLTGLPELKDVLPTVYARLKDGREWTNEAEEEFLRLMLP